MKKMRSATFPGSRMTWPRECVSSENSGAYLFASVTVLTDRKHSVPARNAARARIAVCVSCVLYTQATQHSELWSIRSRVSVSSSHEAILPSG